MVIAKRQAQYVQQRSVSSRREETGFGKAKESLLPLLLYCVVAKPTSPNVLLVPGTLIDPWLGELENWPFFETILSYDQRGVQRHVTISRSQMFRNKRGEFLKIPPTLSYIFENKFSRARRLIIISTYDTHWKRTSETEVEIIPGVRHKPPKFENGKELWIKPPVKKEVYTTDYDDVFGVLVVDEAHRVKNRHTRVWQVLNMQHYDKVILLTPTPIFNSIHDLVGLLGLLSRRVLLELDDARENDAALAKNTENIIGATNEGVEETIKILREIPESDLSKAIFLRPVWVRDIVAAKTDTHVGVSRFIGLLLDLVFIQRSQASILPAVRGSPITLQ
ncbi:Helicase C-terminal [Penicillium angulare]|uniref:Helicase C-terminal n=1 Tax=Penicillium angulare TaxID=116970 RepID=A0A9W9FTR2_9EURO|nr:Helicase C-terminal [Penicillium angulare]